MKKHLYIFIFLIFTSCSKYQKVLKSDDFSYKFTKAVEYYQNEEFNKALPIFDELRTIMLGKEKMEEVSYYFAYSHYSTGDLISAAYLFDLFSMGTILSFAMTLSGFIILFFLKKNEN